MTRGVSQKLLRFTIRTVTPTFAAGAVPRHVDPYSPIRPPAIRGALRAWFRAAAASVLRPVDDSEAAKRAMVNALRDVEAAVFGSTDHASPFAVLPIDIGPRNEVVQEKHVPPADRWPGLRYMGYGIFDNAPEYVHFVDEGVAFHLTLKIRRPFPELEPLVVATVWLWTHFGGLGARVRRGFGSLELAEADLGVFPEQERPKLSPCTAGELINDTLIRGLEASLALFADHLPQLTKYPIDAPGALPHRSLRTLDGIQSLKVMTLNTLTGKDTLEKTGRLFREYRSTLERNRLNMPPLPDYFAVKQSLEQGRTAHEVQRTAFGLPLSFYFRSLGGKKTMFTPIPPGGPGKSGPKHKDSGRLPSPLHFRVHRIHPPGQTPRLVVTLLNVAQGEGADVLLGCAIGQSEPPGKVRVNPHAGILDDAITWMCERAQTLYGST